MRRVLYLTGCPTYIRAQHLRIPSRTAQVARLKFIHTADWHLGKSLNNVSLLADQEFILKALIDLCRKEKPDALFIAGDIYDRSVPSADAVAVLDKVIAELIGGLGIPVIAMAGNHDNPRRTGQFNHLLSQQGLHLFGFPEFPPKSVTLTDDWGPVHVYVLPYIEPEVYRLRFSQIDEEAATEIRSHDQVVAHYVKLIQEVHPGGERAVLLAHVFVGGGSPSDSERQLAVGGAEMVGLDSFGDMFSYVALGHLHGPQTFRDGKLVYSGSPLKYSFSEAGHTKTVPVVDIDGMGLVTSRKVELKPRRDLLTVTGRIEGTSLILDAECAEGADGAENTDDSIPAVTDYLEVRLSNREPVVDAMQIVRKRFPNTLKLSWPEKQALAGGSGLTSGSISELSPEKLFERFIKTVSGEEPNDTHLELITEVTNQVLKRQE